MIDPNDEYTDDPLAGLLDRLADDELEEERRRDILRSLDAEPEGWKRCALVFLEAQTLRRELAHLAQESGSPVREGAAGRRAGASHKTRFAVRGRRWITTISVAAALVVAFSLGRFWLPVSSQVPEREEIVEASTPEPEQDLITLTLPSDAGEKHVQVPLVDPSMSQLAWWWLEDAYYPDEVAAALAQEGHEVLRRRQWLPLTLDDGEEAVVPIDEVEVHPVSYVAYH